MAGSYASGFLGPYQKYLPTILISIVSIAIIIIGAFQFHAAKSLPAGDLKDSVTLTSTVTLTVGSLLLMLELIEFLPAKYELLPKALIALFVVVISILQLVASTKAPDDKTKSELLGTNIPMVVVGGIALLYIGYKFFKSMKPAVEPGMTASGGMAQPMSFYYY